MGEPYFKLKRKLEDLGYNNPLPAEAVPLVECLLADLLQTTRSLQNYMDLSKEALMQRDSLMMEAEPYKCDNAKLIQENNHLHKEIIKLREENLKLSKESRRKLKSLSDEIIKKETMINKLQHEIRDLSLRGLCAETLSSRNKSRKKEGESNIGTGRFCACRDKKSGPENNLAEVMQQFQALEEKNEQYSDEIVLLRNQIEHRDNEIIRLNMLLEGGRPLTAISKDCCNFSSSDRVQKLLKDIYELEAANDTLKKDVESSLEKQHEAMLRALNLADKNKILQEELQKVEALALKVEGDCNKKLAVLSNEINCLQTRIEGLVMKNSDLEKQLANKQSNVNTPQASELHDQLTAAMKENDILNKEIKDLVDLNKSLQDKILKFSDIVNKFDQNDLACLRDKFKESTQNEIQNLLEDERKKCEVHMMTVHEKMSEIMDTFNKHMSKCKGRSSPTQKLTHGNGYMKDLHAKLCESEQKILMLKKENDELKAKQNYVQESSKQNYKDVISQLNAENSELSKENIALSQQLSSYKNLNTDAHLDRVDYNKNETQKLRSRIIKLTNEIEILKKDNHEYNQRYKEALELSEKLKRDLMLKQRDIMQLEEENSSYKMTNRNGKASTEHLREECNFLKEQLKKVQSDVIREKTFANQIKNIQLETERSSHELQNELLGFQKKVSLSKDTIDILERKVKELQSEIAALRNDKASLIDNIRKVDQERDKLVLELDNKVETISTLEKKLKSQLYDINKLENEISDLTRKLTVNKVTEHKLADHETQIGFLNGEILRLTKQLDTAIMENKHLQNSLADANGTLKLTRIELDKSRKEVETLKQELQHYVEEIRRIEELLSHKEAERSDMLEHFASLSVEANILENTNHSLESESASKTVQLQTYVNKIQNLEEKLIDKESIIENQASRIATLTCKISSLESEVKLMSEEKAILEQNISYLKQMCNNLQSEHSKTEMGMGEMSSDIHLYENRIKSLSSTKVKLLAEKAELQENLATTENLLSNARKEIVELKLALQDATFETRSLQESVNQLSRREPEIHEKTLTNQEFVLPLTLEEIHEVSHEEDDDSSLYPKTHKSYLKYSHSGTL